MDCDLTVRLQTSDIRLKNKNGPRFHKDNWTGGIGVLGKIESSGQITEEKYTEH